jgi:hypothetical protein
MGADQRDIDAAGDQRFERRIGRRLGEAVEPAVLQIRDARREHRAGGAAHGTGRGSAAARSPAAPESGDQYTDVLEGPRRRNDDSPPAAFLHDQLSQMEEGDRSRGLADEGRRRVIQDLAVAVGRPGEPDPGCRHCPCSRRHLDGGLQHRTSTFALGLSITPRVYRSSFLTRCVSGLAGSTRRVQ